MKTRVSLKNIWRMIVFGKRFLILTRPRPKTKNLFFLTTLVTLSHCFDLKLEQLSCRKVLKFSLLSNCFFYLLTEPEIWY